MFIDGSMPPPAIKGSAVLHVRLGARAPGYPGGLRCPGRCAVQTSIPVRTMELLFSTQGQHTKKRLVAFLPTTYAVRGNVMFSQVSVILLRGWSAYLGPLTVEPTPGPRTVDPSRSRQ